MASCWRRSRMWALTRSSLITTSSTTYSRRRETVECRRPWKRMRRRPALQSNAVRVRLVVDRSALRSVEHVPAVPPLGACAVSFTLLLFVIELQRLEAAGEEGDAAFGGPGLGGQPGEPALLVGRGGARASTTGNGTRTAPPPRRHRATTTQPPRHSIGLSGDRALGVLPSPSPEWVTCSVRFRWAAHPFRGSERRPARVGVSFVMTRRPSALLR